MRLSAHHARWPPPKLKAQSRNWTSFTIQATGSAFMLAISIHMSSNPHLRNLDLPCAQISARARSASPDPAAQSSRPHRTTRTTPSTYVAYENESAKAQHYSRPARSPRRPQIETARNETWKPLPDTPKSAPPVSASFDYFPTNCYMANSQSPSSSRNPVSPMSQRRTLSLRAPTFEDETDISLFAQALAGLDGMHGVSTENSSGSTPSREPSRNPRNPERQSLLNADAEAEAGLAAMREAEARERLMTSPSAYYTQSPYFPAPNPLREYYHPEPALLHVPRPQLPGGPRPLSAPIYHGLGVADFANSSQGFAEALHGLGPGEESLAEGVDGEEDQFSAGPIDELPNYAQSQREAAERARRAALRRAAELEQRWAASRSHRS